MLKTTVFVFCVLIICFNADGKPTSPLIELNSNDPFDMYVLSLLWPQTAWWDANKYWDEIDKKCTNMKAPKSDVYWSIHGLWPENKQKSQKPAPVNCKPRPDKDTTYTPETNADIKDKWPNYFDIKGASTSNFLSVEWEKHGICATYDEKISSKKAYFDKTVELYKTYDIYKHLENKGIVPKKAMPLPPAKQKRPFQGNALVPKPQDAASGSANTKIKYSDIRDALKKGLGVNPYIVCSQQKGNRLYLHEIRVCFNRQFHLMNCDERYGRSTNCIEPPNPNSKKPAATDVDIEYPQRLPPCTPS